MTESNKSHEQELIRLAAAPSELRSLILDLWQRTRIDWGFVSDRLADAFRREKRLRSHERRFVAETVYGMVRHLRRIDEALRAGGLGVKLHAPDHDRLLAYLVLEAGLPLQDAARHRPDLDWNAIADIDARLSRESNPVRRLGLMCSFPDWLAQALVTDLGERAEAVAAALNQRAPMTIRVNMLRCDASTLIAALGERGVEARQGRYSVTALDVVTRTNLFALEPFKRGMFEAQDEGSQLVAELVAPPPKARVVDYCAGAGGKTLAVAAAMGNRGRILATDIDHRKLIELRHRTRRAGVTTVQTAALGQEAHAALAGLEGKAHRVLLDVPCSGIGALRRNPEARWRLQPADLDRLPVQQLDICNAAVSLVRPGGRIIYATCTLLRRENQTVVTRFLAEHPDFELMPVKALWGAERAQDVADESGTYLALDPARHGTDGFFAAVLRRKA
jgi:16S rRNA (cytosine967-C5)-methyltransferase